MEAKPVIKAFLHKLFKVLNSYRRFIGVKLDLYLLAVFHFYYNHFDYLIVFFLIF